jgi:hypothetical protein
MEGLILLPMSRRRLKAWPSTAKIGPVTLAFCLHLEVEKGGKSWKILQENA